MHFYQAYGEFHITVTLPIKNKHLHPGLNQDANFLPRKELHSSSMVLSVQLTLQLLAKSQFAQIYAYRESKRQI